MKKFIVFCMLCIFLLSVSLIKQEYDFSNFSNLQVQMFIGNNNDEKLEKYSTVKNGNGLIVFCDYEEYKEIKCFCDNINGVTFVFEGDKTLYNKLIKDLNVKLIESGNTDFVGYSNNFDYSVSYCNKKVNVQGYFNGEKIFIGTPLLLGSY